MRDNISWLIVVIVTAIELLGGDPRPGRRICHHCSGPHIRRSASVRRRAHRCCLLLGDCPLPGHLLFLDLLLLNEIGVVVERLIEFQLLHLLSILDLLVLGDAILGELLAEEVVVGEVLAVRLRVLALGGGGSAEHRLHMVVGILLGLDLAALGARTLQRRALDVGLQADSNA